MDPLSILVLVLLLLWLTGAFVIPIGGSLIHLLLVVVVIVVIVRLIQGQRII